ncbi:hypothetical protein CHCC15087_0525 [Bacillus licheniformis]|nr:hypothetical protein CHCC15087_0525 [Bacillus licheniformis]
MEKSMVKSSKERMPRFGISKAFRQRSSVVLPEPEGPKMAITFPFSMFRSRRRIYSAL